MEGCSRLPILSLAITSALSLAIEKRVPKTELVDDILDQLDPYFDVDESELSAIARCLEDLVDAWCIDLGSDSE